MTRKRTRGEQTPLDTLIAGFHEISRQAMALAKRCHQPGGTVVCEVNLPLQLKFNVATAAERDAIALGLKQALEGLPGVEATIIPGEATQRWDLLIRGE